MIAIIICGGKGTRLLRNHITTPKSLIKIDNRSVLEWQLMCLKANGIHEIVLAAGYEGGKIYEELTGTKVFKGSQIHFLQEKTEMGTGGALMNASEFVDSPTLVVYGDVLIDLNLSAMKGIKQGNALGGIFVRKTTHPEDSDLISYNFQGQIEEFYPKPHSSIVDTNMASSGLYVITPEFINFCRESYPEGVGFHLERDAIAASIESGSVWERLLIDGFCLDIGTLKRIEQAKKSWPVRTSGLTSKPTIFLDRDGVINEDKGHIKNVSELTIIEGLERAIRNLNDKGYRVVVVTNQPVIARGETSEVEVRRIHKAIDEVVLKYGGIIEEYYFCPHHPNKGFEGEVIELKIQCECRKPGTGLIRRVLTDFNVQKSSSYVVGDSETDLMLAKASNFRFLGVGRAFIGTDHKTFTNLHELSLFVENHRCSEKQ